MANTADSDEGTQAKDGRSPAKRLVTNVPRLDFITKGGLILGSSYAIIGPPGSGKTVLANQIAFQHVRNGGKALYITLLSESHGRMLENLSQMTFFDPSVIPERLQYLSAYRELEKEGLKGLLELLRKNAQPHGATLLIIDGMDVAKEFARSDLSFKRFLQDLQTFCNILGCTTLLLAPHHEGEIHPENTAVDGIFELSLWLHGPRAVRELIAIKFRGGPSLLGRHEVEISDQGMVIHPRTEVQFAHPAAKGREDRIRMPFGIPRLDDALKGGVLSGSTTLLLGAPGTGKTLLGLRFLLEGARAGQPGVYFGFYETPPRLIEKALGTGMHDFKKYVDEGLIEIQWQPPLEHNMDSLAERLLERIEERKVDRLRLFIDGVSGFRSAAVYPDRLSRFFSALTHQLRMMDVTTLYSDETPLFSPGVEMAQPEAASTVENVILVRYVELRSQLYRLLSIMKMRESAYDSSIREFSISENGITVADTFESAESILTGHARLTSGPGTAPPAKARSALKAPLGSAGKKPRTAKKKTAQKKATQKKAPASASRRSRT
ncbi:circadian clock protein KaiC [Corallococcus praedator]|uniref:non-specific serine/threonine protein kinase n=1 Tax=Corallococcus praedator TaxID=2316724 RepID=A0ABX9QPQ9_9BACT|nr:MULTISPECIES: ATPase domain-containing protein [Corallococcus]RKH28037.1 circadian clock protein KaiC [Corallococcus sp. CA031C]RKI13009.1 circadian clock protein KaiC [Corallococcus praedator]